MQESNLINKQKLFEQVAAHLEQEILAGTLKPGERLPPERDLQLRFGVGRPAIREALITLQRSGIIEIGNGAPARVVRPTIAGVVESLRPAVQQILSGEEGQRNLQGVRLFAEIGLVRNAAENASEEELAELAQALTVNQASIGDMEDFMRTDIAFHYVIAKVMHNPAFLALHDTMSVWLSQQRHFALMEADEDRRSYAAHVNIYQAVKSRDPDAAEAAMRAHLNSGWKAFWRQYQDSLK